MVHVTIGGAGEMGYHLARALTAESIDVTIIEPEPKRRRRAEALDALVVDGDITSWAFLNSLEWPENSTFVAATGIDEVNLVACGLAKRKGARTIARVHRSEYTGSQVSNEDYSDLGIDQVVCPETVAALRIQNLLNQGSLLPSESYMRGRVRVAEGRVDPNSSLVGLNIRDLEGPTHARLFAILRGQEVELPNKNSIFKANDRALVAYSEPETLFEIQKLLGGAAIELGEGERDVRRIMIDGASRVGISLAKQLSRKDNRKDVVLLESDDTRAAFASDQLSRVLVSQREGTNREDLLAENVDTFDAFVGASEDEQHNVLACLMAKHAGVPRTIAVVHQPELRLVLEGAHIDLVVAPRLSTVASVLKLIQGVGDLRLQHMGNTQVLEETLLDTSPANGQIIADLDMNKSRVRIAAIRRQEDIFFPNGDTELAAGDALLVYAFHDAVDDFLRAVRG